MMTNETDTEPAVQPSDEARAEVPQLPRRKTIQFVAFFVVYVLVLLVGYRYAVNTEANMRYLFTTAKHTSAVLALIGQESAVEKWGRDANPEFRRAQLAAWREHRPSLPEGVGGGTVAAAPRGEDEEIEPLSANEAWLHRAYQTIAMNGTLDSTGPSVYFTARYGLLSREQQARAGLARLPAPGAGDTESGANREKFESELADIAARREALPAEGSKRNYAENDRKFTFVLVPDCGAIEVISIYVAAVLAFPTLLRRRFVGLLAGIPILYGVNIFRLSSLAVLAAFDPTAPQLKWFHFGHEYVWQAVFIIFVVAVWLCWIEFVVQRRQA